MVAGNFDEALARAANLVGDTVLVGLIGVDGGGIAAAHLVAAFAADGFDVDFFIGIAGDELVGGLENVGVECAGMKPLSPETTMRENALFGAEL